jgi:hypothetical protein
MVGGIPIAPTRDSVSSSLRLFLLGHGPDCDAIPITRRVMRWRHPAACPAAADPRNAAVGPRQGANSGQPPVERTKPFRMRVNRVAGGDGETR